ncbi:polymorphic toxin-type HINT domain-containing protein [Micromonospora sp. CB01531]|uniref:polymorphic toxin-type HINT domain-containing protein n=1 Tax=Micromonospora sp. CB01531 TaxID=1718947 RepID=UPI00093E2774|nr:Hint domain-containing protein [Micromonospora sp. CB01531]OKI60863.1 hypothetical protein A6A27_29120 [Micromonospora sp. CB01531]
MRRVAIAAMLACAALTVATVSTGFTSSGGSFASRGCTTGTCSDPTNSFTADTLVLMADGSGKRMADVTAGDQVVATDPASGLSTVQPVARVITGTGTKQLVEITVDAGTLTVTANHRFWVVNRAGWHAAAEFAVGDLLGDGAGSHLRVTGLRTVTRQATVHNLDVANAYTFQVLIGGERVLAHE